MIIGSRPIGKDAISALSFFSTVGVGGAVIGGIALLSGGTVVAADFVAGFEFFKPSSLQIMGLRREFVSREALVNKKMSSMFFDRTSPLNRL